MFFLFEFPAVERNNKKSPLLGLKFNSKNPKVFCELFLNPIYILQDFFYIVK